MYVGRRYTVDSEHRAILPYRCGMCGYAGNALVVGLGRGEGRSPYFLDEQGARERAAERAGRSAHQNALLTLSLKSCPRCGTRDSRAVTGFWARSAALLLGSAVAIWLLGLLVYSLDGDGTLVKWIFGPIGLATPAILYFTQVSWKWKTAEHRVLFLSPGGERPRL